MTGKQRSHLRALAHGLSPVVQVGKGGLSDPVVEQIDAALDAHELIKVKVSRDSPDSCELIAAAVERRTRSAVAQIVGRILVVYRRHAQRPRIELPRKRAPRPRATASET